MPRGLWLGVLLTACSRHTIDHEGTPALSTGAAPLLDGKPAVRRTFDMAFLLIVNPDQPLDSASTRANVAKLEELALELEDQFSRSTYGTGELRVDPVVEVYQSEDDLDRAGVVGRALQLSGVQGVIRDRFYADHPDDYDFLAVYSHAPTEAERFGHVHYEMRPLVMGLGREPREAVHEEWGSAGRLRGIGLVLDANVLPDTYDFEASQMDLLLHETVGHSFGVFVPELQLEQKSGHFFAGIEGPHRTVMYARPWEQDPDDPTSFTLRSDIDEATGHPKLVFHPWVLYHVGLLERSEVPDEILCIDIDDRNIGTEITGLPVAVRLDDIIETHGDRILLD